MKESPQDVVTAPYGTWSSPLSAAEVATGAAPIFEAAFRGEHVYYSAKFAAENSRTGLVRTSLSHPGPGERILPEPFNIRSAVHEYGGGAWALDPDSDIVYFVNAADQRVWQLIPGRSPHALTPETSGLIRYGDLHMTPWGLLCVREDCRSTVRRRSIVLITRFGTMRELATQAHFMAWPRISADGRLLTFIGWEHPHMPWDETSLWVVDLGAGGDPTVAAVLHGDAVALLQPEFSGPATLRLCSDHQGHWALYELDLSGVAGSGAGSASSAAEAVDLTVTDLSPALDTGTEIGGPLWQLGALWHLGDGAEVWAHAQSDMAALVRLRTSGGDAATATPAGEATAASARVVEEIATLGSIELHDLGRTHVLLTAKSPDCAGALIAVDRVTGAFTEIATERLDAHDDYYAHPRTTVLGGVPVVLHEPHNPRFIALDRERPPYVVIAHGGPTGQATADMSARMSFFASRGIGVMEVNYGGSTGFGRAWRERLRGQWGIVDVADIVAAVEGLIDAGLADPLRIAISGGSAGGWTALSSLISSDVFACGTSYFGVTDLMRFVVDTHDFERHYVDGLVGPWPEAQDALFTRSPIHRTSDIRVPVAIMQGDRDPIVPPNQAQEFVDMLRLAGVEYIYRLYKGESHGFVRTETIIDSLESEFGFYVDVFGIPRSRRHR
ncbi:MULTISPECIES: prolyl oligopeptidase family serine peptidase [Brevibacterium]|uniref:S9 family peptidase n=1 Tax=Brevibacterium casei TaxID=33889 RepID=A0A7T3ZYX9_9MICO|nr:prolyl oligopeptidase family serine peptidase [Brevibacterium casei]QQB14125.1 S9 family peptidase [Brevibacterium casei]